MSTRATTSALFLALFATACGADTTDDTLSENEQIAMDAAILALDSHRDAMPVDDDELEMTARSNIVDSRADSGCEIRGVVSGVWYDEDLQPLFEGSWFELGTGSQGGTIEGTYGEGLFDGEAHGDDVEATVTGSYDDGVFLGDWATVDEDGEMIGRYERRNDYGGYFFGLWGDCGASVDGSSE